jgi:hypothetical protein
MNRLKYVLALGLAAFAFGCPVRSLFPLFSEKDLVALPAIVGTWTNAEGDTVTIQPAAEKNYQAVFHTSKGETSQYTGHVGKLGNSWFLDSYPADKGIDHHLIRAHIISRIRVDGDSLRVAPLEGDWLKKMIDAGKLNIPYVEPGGDIILTASTEELQKLCVKFAGDAAAFRESPGYARVK